MTEKKKRDKAVGQKPDGEQVELNVFAGVQFIIEDDRLGTRMVYNNVNPELIMLAGKLLTTLAERMMNDAWTAQQMKEARKQAEMDQIIANVVAGGVKMRA